MSVPRPLAAWLVALVAGAGLVLTVLTSLGLLPLYGPARASLDGWRAVAPELRAGAGATLAIALPATMLAAVLGTTLAALMLRPGRSGPLLRVLAVAVLTVPHLVGAAAMGQLLGDGGLGARAVEPLGGSWPVLVGASWPWASVAELAWKESAFVALVVLAATAPGHAERMAVAAGLGASPRQRWWRVFVPTARPAVAVASLVTLVYAIGVYEVAWLLGRAVPEPLPVLAYRLFGSIELVDRPAAAAAAVTTAALSLALAIPALWLLARLRVVRAAVPTSTPDGAR